MGVKNKLRIIGLTYSQTQTGSYALVLAEENGERRIPIMIGAFEAQAIALHLEELHPPRPLTHDLFRNFAVAFDIELKEVFINKLEEGIFYSELIFYRGEDLITIDSRTSDAVALALRFKCPIYTTSDILEKAGIIMKEQDDPEEEIETLENSEDVRYKDLSSKDLQVALKEAVESEQYEKASEIKKELSRRGLSS